LFVSFVNFFIKRVILAGIGAFVVYICHFPSVLCAAASFEPPDAINRSTACRSKRICLLPSRTHGKSFSLANAQTLSSLVFNKSAMSSAVSNLSIFFTPEIYSENEKKAYKNSQKQKMFSKNFYKPSLPGTAAQSFQIEAAGSDLTNAFLN
jgi:ABC-type glycerol-3-phosphate transport system permease component